MLEDIITGRLQSCLLLLTPSRLSEENHRWEQPHSHLPREQDGTARCLQPARGSGTSAGPIMDSSCHRFKCSTAVFI